MFLSVVTKKSNWEVLINNLVIFKKWDEVKNEKF